MDRKQNKSLVPYAKDLRRDMTKEEKRLWYDFLRNHPVRFQRQKILGQYIVDFYAASARLVIELDGSQHFEDGGIAYDARRDSYLAEYGLRIIRIPNNEINRNFDGVCEYLNQEIERAIRT